jgi:hypothetical protein
LQSGQLTSGSTAAGGKGYSENISVLENQHAKQVQQVT